MAWLAGLIAGAALGLSVPAASYAQGGLAPGEGFLTKFSGTVSEAGGPVIDLAGTVGTAIDLRSPGFPADGRHWLDEPHLFSVTAGDVGQVFGVTLDDANPPNIYLTATAAFGLHRDGAGWLDGMWGPGGGPGTVYRLDAANGYQPSIFAEITLDGRANSGAALGNIAFDRRHHQLFVSDLETGMIHRIAVSDGNDLGRYDHGVEGRSNFVDAATGASLALAPVAFDPATSAHVADCPSGDFARTPSCWNFADFRRRVWGLDVAQEPGGNDVRLYYAVWGSQGFGNPDWTTAGDDQQNSVWSVAIADDGSFDTTSVRREFFLPEFFRSPEAIARAGISNPVADIAFPRFGAQNVMLLAERGGVRNLGLSAEDAFAYPHEARVLRYERDASGLWQPAARYDVGFADRRNEGPPYVRAGAAGGAAFGMGYDASGRIDPARADAFVWMTGDALCSPDGACLDPATGTHSDVSEVTGLQGQSRAVSEAVIPDAAFQPYPAPGPVYPAAGLDQSYMIDADVDVDGSGAPIAEELARNDATRVGDVVVFQQAAAAKPDLRIAKRALDPSCRPGEACRFAITITNVGEVPYAGPLSLRETGGWGATMVVPPPPDWSCVQTLANISICDHAPVTLPPGAAISFQVTFEVPAWWSRPVFDNCVELTTPGAGTDGRTYNNRACGYGPTAEPGTPYYAPDLELSKFGLGGQCDDFGNCLFVVRLTNVGAAPYAGPLAFHDHVHFPGATLAAWAPDPEWTCAPAGGDDFSCTHPPVALVPGDFREVTLRFTAPPPTPVYTHVRNCGWIEWGPFPHDYNPGNEYDCALISRLPFDDPLARPILDVEKVAAPTCDAGAGPGGGWLCYYGVRVSNVGSAPFVDPIVVHDGTLGPGATLVTAGAAPWACVPGIGAPAPQTCTYPVVPGGLPPGGSVYLDIYFEVPAAVVPPSGLLNCGTVASDHDGDGIAEDYTSCALSLICHAGSADCPRDLAVFKQVGSLDPCLPGFPCQFFVVAQNISDQPYHGPVNLTEIPDPGVGPLTLALGPPGAACFPAGPGFTCSYPGDIAPGAGLPFAVEFTIPPSYPSTTFKNCASVPPGLENTLAFNDQACATAAIPFPDLAPFGGTVCQRGANCTLDLGIANKGLLPFVGNAGVRGTLSPAVPVVSVTPQTPGVTCSITGKGTYECRGQNLNIPSGGEVNWQVVIEIAEDFPGDQITHTKDMIWPDQRVKDKRSDNDRNVSIITIEGPKALQVTCSGGRVVDNACVCPKGSDVQQVGTNAYRCVPQVTCSGGQVVDNACVCPKGNTVQQVGTNAYRCVPQITCSGGRVVDNACVCPKGNTVQQTGATAYRCVPQITCSGGTVSNNQCLCPRGTEVQQTGRTAYRCVPTITCKGGTVQNNQCLCPRGSEVQQVGRFDYACVRPQPQITCKGGIVRNNECLCPKGTEVQQVGRFDYACVRPQPQIQCSGGTVQNNECVCPRGLEARQVGSDVYRCVKSQVTTPTTPTITCSGGTVQNGQCVCPQGSPQRVGETAYRCPLVLQLNPQLQLILPQPQTPQIK